MLVKDEFNKYISCSTNSNEDVINWCIKNNFWSATHKRNWCKKCIKYDWFHLCIFLRKITLHSFLKHLYFSVQKLLHQSKINTIKFLLVHLILIFEIHKRDYHQFEFVSDRLQLLFFVLHQYNFQSHLDWVKCI